MQNLAAIVRQPILFGLLLSAAAHGMVLHGRAVRIHTPPVPLMETGRTVLHLTLLQPSPPSHTESPPPAKTEVPVEPAVEQLAQPIEIPEPARTPPDPEPVEPEVEQTTAVESPDLDATLDESQGVTAEASADGVFHPAYPRVSRQRGEEGTVTVSVQVLPDGSVGTVEITHSSGFKRLDRAALDAARNTTFTPALLLGRVVESTTELSYTFRLTND